MNDLETDAGLAQIALPPGTELVPIEIIDRRTGLPALIQRLMLQPQRIILVKSLLDSLAGVVAPVNDMHAALTMLHERVSGQVWVCEFGHQHHTNIDRVFKRVDRKLTLHECEAEWVRAHPNSDIVPFYIAHMPMYYFSGQSWHIMSFRDF